MLPGVAVSRMYRYRNDTNKLRLFQSVDVVLSWVLPLVMRFLCAAAA